MKSQKWQDKTISQATLIRLLLIIATILLVITGGIFLIFSGGGWANALSAIFTTFGVVIALLQWVLPLSPSSSRESISSEDRAYSTFVKQIETETSTNLDQGAVIIYTRPEMLGKQVEILNLQTQGKILSTVISMQRVNDYPIYAAVAHLRPGNYIVQSPTATSIANARSIVTVYPEKIASVIWTKRE